MRALTAFPSSFLNLRLLEEVLYDLPPLEGVFLHWHTYGVQLLPQACLRSSPGASSC